MDNSKVLKPIIGPQESAESKKKEGNKKKKALIVAALAFLIATGTIAASIAVVKANMPKLEIRFDDWFVESFDFNSMQSFIDENRLSKGDIDKRLPGYVDKKAKDQNVKNPEMITSARLTNKIPENNTLPHGIYVEMTAELDYAFTYQADLSLEDRNENTKELSANPMEPPKKQRYFISKDKSKLYVLVYERESSSDESLPGDLQTFNDFKISNCPGAFKKLNDYIDEQARRYTSQEFEEPVNWKPGLEIFREALIGLETQYVVEDGVSFDYDDSGQKVMKIKLDDTRSNFEFTDEAETNGNVTFDVETGTIIIKNLQFYTETELKLDTLQKEIQEYIKQYDQATDEGRYTLEEFRTKMGEDKLRILIANSLGVAKEVTPPEPEPEQPENPDTGDGNNTNPLVDPITPPGTIIDHSKIENLYMRGNDLVIDLVCDEKQKYTVPKNYDEDKYTFDQVNDRLIVKNLKYYTEINISNTSQAFNNLDNKIINVANQYTFTEFKAFAEGNDTQQQCKELIASGLRTNGKEFDVNLITGLSLEQNPNSETKATLKIQFDNDFKKYKTDPSEQYSINRSESTMEIILTFFKEVQMNDLKDQIQEFIDSEQGQRYTVTEFEQKIKESTSNELQQHITQLVEMNIPGSTNVNKFKYDNQENKLTFELTIQKYEKFPSTGNDIQYELLNKNTDGSTNYKVTVSNLLYWFDFKIADSVLKSTKQDVADYIINEGICSSDDKDENTYTQEVRNVIYNKFGDISLENGRKLSEFMTDNNNDFKLENHSNFIINLKPKIQQERRMRTFYPISLTNDGIQLQESDKVLKFQNFTFAASDKNFVLDKKNKIIYGVSDIGKNAKVLNVPKKYPVMDIRTGQVTVDGKKQNCSPFYKLNNVEKIIIPDTVERVIGRSLFAHSCPKLTAIETTGNLKEFDSSESFRNLPLLTKFDFAWLKNINKPLYIAHTFDDVRLDHFLMPRNLTQLGEYYFQGDRNHGPDDGTAKAKYIISWASRWYQETARAQINLKAICILSNSITFDNPGWTFKNVVFIDTAKFYVTSSTVKQQLEKVENVPSNRIYVYSNLESMLKSAGKIPRDW